MLFQCGSFQVSTLNGENSDAWMPTQHTVKRIEVFSLISSCGSLFGQLLVL